MTASLLVQCVADGSNLVCVPKGWNAFDIIDHHGRMGNLLLGAFWTSDSLSLDRTQTHQNYAEIWQMHATVAKLAGAGIVSHSLL